MSEARKCELYPELLEALQHQAMVASVQVDERSYAAAQQALRYYSTCARWVEYAEEKAGLSGRRRMPQTAAALKHGIERLERMASLMPSGRIAYCRWSLQRDYALLQSDRNMAREAQLSAQALLWSQPWLATADRLHHFATGKAQVEVAEQAQAMTRLMNLETPVPANNKAAHALS